MKPRIDWSLYLVTDGALHREARLEDAVAAAARGGCTAVQLREKTATSAEFLRRALAVKKVTDGFGIPLIVNDRVDIALAADAAGVHVGADDLPVRDVRRIVGPDRIVGASATTLGEAVAAAEAGADYLGVGAMFATGTKTDAAIVSMDVLREIRTAVAIPLVVIGGVNLETLPLFRGTGIDGLAVVSAILARPDAEQAARELRQAWREL